MSGIDELIDAVRRGECEQVARLIDGDSLLVAARDDQGATALHYATLTGQREVARLLVERGADINAPDDRYGATPAGWAIEYLRELGAHLTIELADFADAISNHDNRWVARWLQRFPTLRTATFEGKSFVELAREAGNEEAAKELRDKS